MSNNRKQPQKINPKPSIITTPHLSSSSSSNLENSHYQSIEYEPEQRVLIHHRQRISVHDESAHNRFLSNSLDDLNPRPRVRVAFRSPLRTTLSNTSLNREPSLSRSTEVIQILQTESKSISDYSGIDDETVMEISGVDPKPKARQVQRSSRPTAPARQAPNQASAVAATTTTASSGGSDIESENERIDLTRRSLTKLNRLIDSNIEKELQKALNRVNKRKTRIPQILGHLDTAKGKERRNLEEELSLMMRKHLADKTLLEMYGFPCPSDFAPTPLPPTPKPNYQKPWESGYSSQEDILSGGGGNRPIKKSSSEYKLELQKNLKKIETGRTGAPSTSARSKAAELAIEQVSIEPLAEAEIDLPVNVANNRSRAQPRLPFDRYTTSRPLPSAINDYGHLSDDGARSNPMAPAGSSSYEPRSRGAPASTASVRNTSKPGGQVTISHSTFINTGGDGAGDAGDGSRRNNSGGSSGNDGGPAHNHSAVPSLQSNEECRIEYVEYENLASLNMTDFELFEDSSGEVNLIDLVHSNQYIVLPVNWRESDLSFYFAEEDIDFKSIDVYQEASSNRNYILDKRNNRKYFLVPARAIKKLSSPPVKEGKKRNNVAAAVALYDPAQTWSDSVARAKSNSPERVEDSAQVLHVKYADEQKPGSGDEHTLDVDYVEEFELEGVDLDRFEIEQDSESGEIALLNSRNRRQYWIVLPNGWRTAENLPYINEEDISLIKLDFYVDARTKRKYVIDDKTGQRYYIIPNFRDGFKKFVDENNLLKSQQQQPPPIPTEEKQLKSALKKPWKQTSDSDNQRNQQSPPPLLKIGNEVLTNFESEPSNARLRNMARMKPKPTAFSPPRNTPLVSLPNENLTSTNPTGGERVGALLAPANLLIKQPGKQPPTRLSTSNDASRSASRSKSPQQQQPYNNNNTRPRLIPARPSLEPHRPNLPAAAVTTTQWTADQLPNPRPPQQWQQPRPRPALKPYQPYPQPNVNSQQRRPAVPPPIATMRLTKEKRALLQRQQQLLRAKQDAARKQFFAQKLPMVGDLWLHQLLINNKNRKKNFDRIRKGLYVNSQANLVEAAPDDGRPRIWRSLTDLNDPTLLYGDDNEIHLNRDRLVDVQMYGYEKYNRNKRRVFGNVEDNDEFKENYTPPLIDPNVSFGHQHEYPHFRGILTEDFCESRVYRPLQINPFYQALFPYTKSTLKQQFLCTPMYLKDAWVQALKQSNSMQPRIILINDNEHIPHKNRGSSVYVQYVYQNEAVLGADRAYQLMLPDRGPTEPCRPLLISPAKISKAAERRQHKKPELALREAPVFVYHQNGPAFYENLAQYLAGKQARLSPHTARKLLQFADMAEFEAYLTSKIARDEAKRLAVESGESLINVDAIKNNLINLLDDDEAVRNREYYHFGCEYDPLRPPLLARSNESLTDTKQYIVNGKKIKSTFIAFKDDDQVERVNVSDLPPTLASAMQSNDEEVIE